MTPDSAATNETAPIARPRATSGTIITETRPSSRIIRRCSASSDASTSISSVISGWSSERPVRITFGTPVSAVGIDRIPIAELAGELDPVGVDVGDRDVAQLAVLADELDAAPVGEARDREVGELAQGVVRVEGGGEQRARVGEKRQPLGGLALRLVQARPLERVRGLLRGGREEGPLLDVELLRVA